MRKFALSLALLFPLLLACAGGSSRYGCPAKDGYSCKSVSEVYADVASGKAGGKRNLLEPPGNGKSALPAAGRRFPKGGIFRPGKNMRGRAGDKEVTQAGKMTPVYVPPPAIRIFIAPWQDARGVFHSGKYVYAVPGRGRWTIGGKTVPPGGSPGGYAREIRLQGTEGAR